MRCVNPDHRVLLNLILFVCMCLKWQNILITGYLYNSARTVQYLDIPDDENLVYNMHCYEPLKFTHEKLWENYGYFLKAVLPVAEEKMKLEA